MFVHKEYVINFVGCSSIDYEIEYFYLDNIRLYYKNSIEEGILYKMSFVRYASTLCRMFFKNNTQKTSIPLFSHINEHKLPSDLSFEKINSLNNSSILKLIYELSSNFHSKPELSTPLNFAFLSASKKLNDFNDNSVKKILSNMQYLKRLHYNKYPSEFLQNLLSRLKNIDQKILSIQNLNLLSSFIQNFKDNFIEYEALFQSCIAKINVFELDIKDQMLVLKILSELAEKDKHFDFDYTEGKSIYSVMEEIFNKSIDDKSINTTKIHMILKLFITSDRGSEDFFRKMENIVFSNLHDLSDKDIITMPSYYYKRILHDHKYIVLTIYKSLYEEFLNRIDNLNLHGIAFFLHFYWHKSHFYGMYCDEKLTNKLVLIINDTNRMKKENQREINSFLVNSLAYIENARQLDKDTLDLIYNAIKLNFQSMSAIEKLNVGVYFSRSPYSPLEFWSIFKNSILEIQELKSIRLGILYSISLTLKLRFPEKYEIIKENMEPFIPKFRESWKIDRDVDVSKTDSSHLHNLFKMELEKLGVEYACEFYDEYYLDIALKKYKICYEILGPGHYLFESRLLNGRTYNRKCNLEKLGWTYYIFPFYKTRPTNWLINNFIRGTLPLDH